jgi:hypothetical protein
MRLPLARLPANLVDSKLGQSLRSSAASVRVLILSTCRSRGGASGPPYNGLPDVAHPFRDRDILVTACGRICMHRKKINISTALAGQKFGIKEVDDGIWLVGFTHYDLGYIDLEQRTWQTIDNPFGTRLSPMS